MIPSVESFIIIVCKGVINTRTLVHLLSKISDTHDGDPIIRRSRRFLKLKRVRRDLRITTDLNLKHLYLNGNLRYLKLANDL